jgi:hypothetical protein
VVACQAERSQHKNRSPAMKLLKAKLYELELQKRNDERDALYAGKAKIDFGSQIRSYVLQPYQMVKDLRTGWQTSDTRGFLDGDLDGAVQSFLLMHAGEAPQARDVARRRLISDVPRPNSYTETGCPQGYPQGASLRPENGFGQSRPLHDCAYARPSAWCRASH